uniref:Uncharacterized protein n=1 Tax=Picea sitchensis TaxID=3332 RepID=D5ADC7_PICSI|nr:unknown [Picea sitchensis]
MKARRNYLSYCRIGLSGTLNMLLKSRDQKYLIGEASCGICQESFNTSINGIPNGLMNVSV